WSSRFFVRCSGGLRDLHSFPTRRSSDLGWRRAGFRRGMGNVLPHPHDRAVSARAGAVDSLSEEPARNRQRGGVLLPRGNRGIRADRKSTRLNSSHVKISYAVFCLKKNKV